MCCAYNGERERDGGIQRWMDRDACALCACDHWPAFFCSSASSAGAMASAKKRYPVLSRSACGDFRNSCGYWPDQSLLSSLSACACGRVLDGVRGHDWSSWRAALARWRGLAPQIIKFMLLACLSSCVADLPLPSTLSVHQSSKVHC